VLALSSLEIVFLKICFLEKKRNKANVTFVIFRGLRTENLLFSRGCWLQRNSFVANVILWPAYGSVCVEGG